MPCTDNYIIISLCQNNNNITICLVQSEHIGFPLFDLIHDDDQSDVRRALREAEIKVVTQNLGKRKIICTFNCSIILLSSL